MKILILTEAGTTIGRGHLSRSLGIRDGFENIDIVCYKEGNFETPKDIKIYDWHKNSVEDLAKSYEKVIVDSYLMGEKKNKEIGSLFSKVAVIDDYNRMKYEADLIINPNIYGDKLDYSNQTAKILGGKKYIILRDDIIEYKKSKHIGFAKTLLITVGGTDNHNLLPKLVEAFSEEFIKVHVLAGGKKEELEKEFTNDSLIFHSHVDSKKMAELYSISDLAITAGGVTMSELSFSGVPFVAIETSQDQGNNMKAYQEMGMIEKVLKAEDENLIANLKEQIEKLKDEKTRQDLSLKGQVLVSPKGAGNIVEAVSEI
ncbi:MAG: hypothetical protein OIF32_11075 [Campylobacterales bacterium]|nr:hypothetical protein [Campylobacterales bacterium]